MWRRRSPLDGIPFQGCGRQVAGDVHKPHSGPLDSVAPRHDRIRPADGIDGENQRESRGEEGAEDHER
jgi:hypothetical protein